MKTSKILLATLFGFAVTIPFTSCSDDDEWSWEAEGSNVEMQQTRAFVLNEGSYGYNNSAIGYFDYSNDALGVVEGTTFSSDIYAKQNGKQIGDTGQDLIVYDGAMYLVAYGSSYIAKLDGVGKEVSRLSFTGYSNLGQPRYVAADDGFLYVSSYGGYVSKINASTLQYVDSVKVGLNPEQLIVEDDIIYCVNSGWGMDNTMSVIDAKSFDKAETVTIMTNPQRIVAAGDKLVIQGYGSMYECPVDVYDIKTKQTTNIGNGTSIASNGETVYVVNSTTDYSTSPYTGTTTVYAYNANTGATTKSPLKNMPDELTNGCSYGISVNPYNNHIYICLTNYVWDNGVVYHFDSSGNYVGKVSSCGQNPSKVVFMR